MTTTLIDRHQVWGTIAGERADLLQQQASLLCDLCIRAIEYRADLMPESLLEMALKENCGKGKPVYVAHYGTGNQSSMALSVLARAVDLGVDGVLFHSGCSHGPQIIRVCVDNKKQYVAAFHSQLPVSLTKMTDELQRQAQMNPMFCKLAVRATNQSEALEVIEATSQFTADCKIPIAAAVLGPERWARFVLPLVGSRITFVTSHTIVNEFGNSDEQLTLEEYKKLSQILRYRN